MRLPSPPSRAVLFTLATLVGALTLASPVAGQLAAVDGEQLELVPPSLGLPYAPAVTAAGSGWAVVWTEYLVGDRPGGQGIFARRLDHRAAPAGAPLRVDGDGSFVERILPDVAGKPDGTFAVVWHDIAHRETFARGFDAADRPLGPPTIANVEQEHWQIYGTIASIPSGGYVTSWVTGGVGDDGIEWPRVADARRLDAAARPVGPELRVNTTADADDRPLDLAVGLEGESLVAWYWWRGEPELWVRRLAAAGTPLGPDLLVADRVNPHVRPGVCALPGGRFLLAWSGESGVRTRAVEADGTLAETTRAIDGEPGWWGVPSLACDRFGAVVLAHRSADGDIVARELDLDGEPVGEPLVVNEDDGLSRQPPEVAIGPGGRALLAWQGTDGPHDPHAVPRVAIYGRLLRVGPEECVPSATDVCLGGGRFRTRALWRNPYGPGSGIARAGPVHGDSGTFWFFRPGNLETLVKVLDGRPVNGSHWVFTGSLSTVEHWIEVADPADGRSRTYHNPPHLQTSLADTEAFDRASETAGNAGERAATGLRPSVASDAALCVPDPTRLCLAGGRFAVEVDWEAAQHGTAGPGRAIPFTADTGAFWFFREGNLELMVKVLDGRPVNGRFWAFWAGLSSVDYTLRIHDLVAGRTHVYPHPEGAPAGGADTGLEP